MSVWCCLAYMQAVHEESTKLGLAFMLAQLMWLAWLKVACIYEVVDKLGCERNVE